MNRSRHKITLALVFFGTVVLAPVALAQSPDGKGTATIEFVGRGPFITEVSGLQMGTVFRPRPGTANTNLIINCGPGGIASTDGNAERPADDLTQQACGQVDLLAGSAELHFTLAFAGNPATDLQNESGRRD